MADGGTKARPRAVMAAKSARRIAAAMLALLAAIPGGAGAGEPLAGGRIAETFSGMTLDGVYPDGEFFSETYNEDGSIRYHGADGADTGSWTVEDGRFCTFYEEGEGACFRVEREGPNCFSFFADPSEDEPEPPPGAPPWTSRGWDRSKPPTCPTAPQVDI